MIRLVLTLLGRMVHWACGAWELMSFSSGGDTSLGKVMSWLPAMKESMRVDWLAMIAYSMPSRYGRPLRQ